MRVLVVGDVHWQEYSSILRKQGKTFSVRLENLIKSINFVEEESQVNNVDAIVYLGDFFDNSTINYNEITALSMVQWNSAVPHYFLVGNHEIASIDTTKSTAHIFKEMCHDFITIDEPISIPQEGCSLCFLPYVRDNWKSINEYFPDITSKIVFSHNDIKGIQMGQWLSTEGLDLDDISENCTLFFNGHLHNNQHVKSNVINVGILSGRDFGEDASKYKHLIYLLDTNTKEYSEIINPYAFNFYKIDTTTNKELNVNALHDNAVITVKCYDTDKVSIKSQLDSCSSVVEYRLIIEPTTAPVVDVAKIDLSVNHIDEFKKYCRTVIDNTDVLEQELNIICK